ncbi:MAG: hypothetical protein Q3979_01120 [Actinomycetaceae bacterium]|nr:hypothetical protein [Actinomycetaceae bacterium]
MHTILEDAPAGLLDDVGQLGELFARQAPPARIPRIAQHEQLASSAEGLPDPLVVQALQAVVSE